MRKARGLSQNELAERADVNDKYLGEIERGVGNPSLEVLMKVAKALGVDLATVVGDPVTAHRNSGHVRHLNFPPTSSSSAASDRPNHRFGFIVPRPQSSSSRKTTRIEGTPATSTT